MRDRLSPEQRSRNLRAIKGRDTRPEWIVRRLLHAMGYRFLLHRRDLPGRPDVVLPRHRVAVLIHGCFWHRHSCARGRSEPSTRRAFWRAKFAGNVERDRRAVRALRREGWRVLVVWECQTRDMEQLRRQLARFLQGDRGELAQRADAASPPRLPTSRPRVPYTPSPRGRLT
ncbi:MAG: DNA mismatch endonuclease Vsr [Phycisphaeraceae bacterium]|nr:DNA mismatch endonuclease Vsr [Phycisphaeraceae bacterium]